MSDTGDDRANQAFDGGDGQGKQLIRVGGPRGLSLADLISEKLFRLSWRTPLHSLRLKGRHPLKLIAVTDDPFMGDPLRGEMLLNGRLTFRSESYDVKTLDPARVAWAPDFAEYFHSFAWLRDLSTVATRQQAVPVAEALMRKWLANHLVKVADPAWRPDLWGRRLQFWTAHAPLILSSSDLVYRSDVLHALARGARHLDRAADRAPVGIARIAAWCGVLTAGLMIPGGDPRRAFGEAGLGRAISTGITADGGIIDRAPSTLFDAIQILTLLRETYGARRIEPPEYLTDALGRMVSALLGVCHGDGGLSSWQGDLPISAGVIAQTIEATGVRTRPMRRASSWGYQRLSHQGTVVIIDSAPPPRSRMIRGACASTLAFEFSDGDERIVVNCGGARGIDLRLPAALGEGLRTTAAHSTLVVSDTNSTALNSDGSLGRGVTEIELAPIESETASRIELSHNGYARRHGVIHRRTIALGTDGRDVRGEDGLLPANKRGGRSANTPFAIRFHLHPRVEVSPTADGAGALLRTRSGSLWQFRARGAALAIEESVWVDEHGIPRDTLQLVLTGQASSGGSSVSWLFHRARKGD